MKFGERIETAIAKLDEKGRGLGIFPTSGKDIIVPSALPGETAVGEFAGKDKGKIRLSNIVVSKTSPDRAEPPCPHFGKCGGCALQHLKPEAQSNFKISLIEQACKEAQIDLSPLLDKEGAGGVLESPEPLHYRNRMDFAFGPNGELGLKEAGRWDSYVDLQTCLLVSPEMEECRRRVAAWARGTGLPFWDNRRYSGFFRYFVIREGRRTGERMAALVTSAGELPDAARESLVETLKPLCTTIYHGINPKITDLSISEELELLHGQPRLHEKISGVTYAIHPNSFFQTNTVMAERLLEYVRALVLAGPHARLLDLYCGSGFFSLALAHDVESALGIELDAFAIASAQENARLNSIANAAYRAEPAEQLSWTVEKPDVAVVDPPRSGLHPKVRNALLAGRPPRLIYVSCNPKALAADLKELTRDYAIASVQAFDLFPQTPHVETVVELNLKKTL